MENCWGHCSNVDVTNVNCNEICRLCLTREGEMSPIFSRPSDVKSISIPFRIMAFTSIKLETGDGLPGLICHSCLFNVERVYEFKQQCEQSDAFLRNYYYSGDYLHMDLSAPKNDAEDHCNIKSSFSVSRTGLNNELQCIKLIKTKNDGELMIVKTDVQEHSSVSSSGSVINNRVFNTKMTEEDNDGIIQSPLKEGSFEKDGIESVVMVVDPTARTLDSNPSDNDIDNDTEVKRKSSDVIEVPTPTNLLLSSQFPPHMLTNHCPSCNKPFFNLFLLQRHIMIHNQEPCFPCDYCDKIFNDRAALKSHWRDHAGLGKLTCMTCGEAFKERSELSEHVVIHDVIKPYHCVVCSRKFSNRSDLRKHLIIHTGARPYVCACGKSFTRSTNLNKHARAHAGERPFNCPSCTKTFSTKADLTRHSVTHTGEKPYSCTICGLAFSRRDKLTRHIKLHEKNRPFHCERCALSFNNRKVLAAHYQIHHAGVSLPTEISSAAESNNKTNSTNQQNVKKNNTNNKSSRKLLFPKKISKIPVQVEVKKDDETSEDVIINVDPFHLNNDSVDQEIIHDNGNL